MDPPRQAQPLGGLFPLPPPLRRVPAHSPLPDDRVAGAADRDALGARAGDGGLARRRGKGLQLAIVGLVILAAVGYLVYSGLRTNVYYRTVSELQTGDVDPGRQIRLAGNVVPGSIVREEGSSTVRFQVADAGGALPVVYKGAVPDIFGPEIEVVLEGRYNPSTGFAADTMLAKCPSKFEEQASSGGQ
jgi:cytochrome c-type biogenesis protein CcmE